MQWLDVATSRAIVQRALKIGAVVGTLLIAINHGDAIIGADIDLIRSLKMLLCFVVPYSVSTYVAVQASAH